MIANNQLHDICSRIATLEGERAEVATQISEIKAQAKSDGFDPALIAKTVRIMLMEGEKQKKALDQHDLFDSYLNAVGLAR